VEGWTGNVTASAGWQLAEGWSAVLTTGGAWQLTEAWTATATTSAAWAQVESWSATIKTSAEWQMVESWTATVTTLNEWRLVESWSATVTTAAVWAQAESWSTTVSTGGAWQLAEAWTATATTSATWAQVESWTATIKTSAEWGMVESWTATATASALWSQIETWTATVTSITLWSQAEVWSETITGSAGWQLAEAWQATAAAAAQWSLAETWTATITAQIPAPILISPPNGENRNTLPTLRWDNLLPADNFQLQIDNNPDFTSPENDITVFENSYTPPALQDNLWYWRVRTFRNNENSAWSDVWKFRVDRVAPDWPTMISPINGENLNDNTPLLRWQAPPENSLPLVYTIQISRNAIFTDLKYTLTTENENIECPYLEDNVWYWRIRAKDNAGNERLWSGAPYRSFRVDTIPPQPVSLISPAQGAFTDATPYFTWTAVTQENSLPIVYRVTIDDDSTFTPPLVLQSPWLTDNWWEVPGPNALPYGTYYWLVEVKDNAGNIGENSENRYFLVDDAAPDKVTLYRPDNNTSTTSKTVEFEWYIPADNPSPPYASGVARYWIQIDNEPSFDNTYFVYENENITDNTYIFTFSKAGTYYWRVRAIDAVGNIGAWADNFTLIILEVWWLVESWSATATTTAWYRMAESWSGTVMAVAGWNVAESWQVMITTAGGWQMVETWSATTTTSAPWALVESWTSTIGASAQWQPVESWSVSIKTVAQWEIVESWTATVTALEITAWKLVESWTAAAATWTAWRLGETWAATITAQIPAPTLISPPDGENRNTIPILDWEDNTLPIDNFEVQVDNDQDFSAPLVRWENTG
ncbi:MAG: hypothetical protein ACK4GQ_04495, partial [Candidatus Hadarchaeales archaeon]